MSSLDHIVDMVSQGKVKKIVVMAGAGISTAAGIPDFRSPGTGLYANLAKFDLPYPEAIFTMDYFEENPKPFFVLAKELYPDLYIPTLSHFFVKLLESKGVLLRHYTQNIDCLDSIAGVSDDLVVEAHGSFKTAHCINEDCREEHSKEWVRDLVFRDEIPHCRQCGSLVKPDITFFGEGLPKRFFDLMHDDLDQCDLLMVMGTSLAVHPFAGLVNLVSKSVPRLLINRERVGESKARGVGLDFDGRFASAVHRDALMLGDCDAACVLLADRLGWKPELLALRREFLAARQTTA
ncbi:NAD-dependent deacetylase sirtuin-2 [Linderina pennispora]|uniref:NAD-dependent protein deacetylase n=1 Tax=Linderina pennispora TaxID=61395 RepID=A0A1Y1W0C5_9FUNG|nr:NAD-dependent deacetylase sirtuin-2 [Linderina pennispora]ORX66959.1 NAD-dependent deacetylase sirtuin-2 [Linderina pennispora]